MRNSNTVTRLLLVRHAQSEWNATGRWQGIANPPLSELGAAQAAEAAARIAALDIGFDAVAASDLERARRTAALVARALGIEEVVVDEGLRERDIGEWSGHTSAEIDERWPGMRDAWRNGHLDRMPGGESNDEVASRLLAALARVGDAHPDGCVLVVTHGGCIRTLLRMHGVRRATVGNLAGEWFTWDGGRLRADDAVVLLQPDHRTVPTAL